MAKKNRSTLKRYFSEGAMPSADQFGDLIDSSLNTIDEGFTRTVENGYEISLIGEHDRLISFFRNAADQEHPVWSISYDKRRDTLTFIKADDEDEQSVPPLTLAPDGRVGINNDDPQWSLDVKGVVAATGRIGTSLGGKSQAPADCNAFVLADGNWHDITGPLEGCHAYEVMAGAGNKGTGNYALMNAIAMNTFNPRGWLFNIFNLKKRINYHDAYYLSRGNKIKLRWRADGDKYYLQMRTNSNYGPGVRIRYYLTQLWFDADMSGSWNPDEAPPSIEGQAE